MSGYARTKRGPLSSNPLRINQGDLKLLEPSFGAIEFARLLERPDDFLARMRAASKEFKPVRTDADKAAIRAARADRGLRPSEREDLIKKLIGQSNATQRTNHSRAKAEAKHWCALVRLFEAKKPWFDALPANRRATGAKKLEDDFNRGNRAQLQEEAKSERRAAKDQQRAERKNRADGKRELKTEAKRLRARFGWRQRGHARTPWAQHARSAANPMRDYQEYRPKAQQLWDTIYSNFPDLLNQDPLKVRREVLRDHEMTKATGQDEWADAHTYNLAGAEKAHLKKGPNPGMANIGADELKSAKDEILDATESELHAMLEKLERERKHFQQRKKSR